MIVQRGKLNIDILDYGILLDGVLENLQPDQILERGNTIFYNIDNFLNNSLKRLGYEASHKDELIFETRKQDFESEIVTYYLINKNGSFMACIVCNNFRKHTNEILYKIGTYEIKKIGTYEIKNEIIDLKCDGILYELSDSNKLIMHPITDDEDFFYVVRDNNGDIVNFTDRSGVLTINGLKRYNEKNEQIKFNVFSEAIENIKYKYHPIELCDVFNQSVFFTETTDMVKFNTYKEIICNPNGTFVMKVSNKSEFDEDTFYVGGTYLYDKKHSCISFNQGLDLFRVNNESFECIDEKDVSSFKGLSMEYELNINNGVYSLISTDDSIVTSFIPYYNVDYELDKFNNYFQNLNSTISRIIL